MNLFKNKHPLVKIQNALFIGIALKAFITSQLYLKTDYISDALFLDVMCPISVVLMVILLALAIYVDRKKLNQYERVFDRLFFYAWNAGILVLTVTGILHFKYDVLSFDIFGGTCLIFGLFCALVGVFGAIRDAKNVQERHPVYQRHKADKFIVPASLIVAVSLFYVLMYNQEWQDWGRSSSILVLAVITFGLLTLGIKHIILLLEKRIKSK